MKANTVLGKALNWKIFALITAVFFLAAAPLAAQDYGKDRKSHTQGQTDFSEGELEKFVQAQDEIDGLRNEYTEELQGVKDEDQALRLQQVYGRKMAEAVEEIGLTVNKYNQILKSARFDSELREKIEDLSAN